MAAIAKSLDEDLPRQPGLTGDARAAYRLFGCVAVTQEAVMGLHLAQCTAEAARQSIVLMVHDDTTLDFSIHRRFKGAGRVGDDHGTGLLVHSCLAVLPLGEGLAHQTNWTRSPKGVPRQTREVAVWVETVAAIRCPPVGSRFVSVGDHGVDVFCHLESVWDTGWDAVVRAAQDRRPAAGGNSLTALRPARAMGAATAPTRQGEIVVCIALAGPGASAAASTDGFTPNRYFLRGVICLANDPEGPFRPHDPRRGLPARPGCASPK